MSGNDLPNGTVKDDASPTFRQSVDAIADLLDDSDIDPNPDDEDQDHDADEGDEVELEASADGDTEEADEGEPDPEGQSEAEDDDDPDDIKGGRFAPDSAKVKLEDGRTVSIAELKRGTLFQADYTRKTTELAEERKRFSEQKALADDFARNIAREREILLAYAQQFMPKPPDPAMKEYDRFGYEDAKEAYQGRMAALQHLAQQHQAWQARQQQETEAQAMERKRAEAAKLFETLPELRDREKYARFWNETVEALSEYGFTAEELNEADDHRFYKVFRDLVQYRKARKSAPKVKEDVQRKPVLKSQKRMNPQNRSSREKQARYEQLKRSRDFESGVRSLMDLDL